jgi:hypothetical protein
MTTGRCSTTAITTTTGVHERLHSLYLLFSFVLVVACSHVLSSATAKDKGENH